MPSGRISKTVQAITLEALEALRGRIYAALKNGDLDDPMGYVVNLARKRITNIDSALHTIRDTMEVYAPCDNCGGTGYVQGDDDVPFPIAECPVCLGNQEERTCPKCRAELRESAAGHWTCGFCGWSSIKVETKGAGDAR